MTETNENDKNDDKITKRRQNLENNDFLQKDCRFSSLSSTRV